MNGILPVEKVFRKGGAVTASGRIPADAEFFQDHFPDFPVLPGVVALDLLKQTIEQASGKKINLMGFKNVKFSSYLKPGDEWESLAEISATRENETEWAGKILHQGRPAVTAKLIFNECQGGIKSNGR